MKRSIPLFTIILTILIMFISTSAMACWGCPTYYNDNRVTNEGGQGGAGGAGGNATIEKGAVKVKNKNTNINVNVNKTKNVNKNTNIQGQKQAQGQIQGQLQGQIQSANNEGVSQTTIFNEAETKREHIGGSVAYAKIGSYNGKYEKGAEFLSVDTITAVKKTFSFEAALEDYGHKYGKGKCKTTGHSYNGRHENDPTKEIDVYTLKTIKKLDKKFKVIGFLTIKAIKEGTDSFLVMQKGVLSAGLMKGDAFVVTSEGANFKPKASGWGIGNFISGGQIADHGNRGNATAGGGGTGFSKTLSELLTFPWMTIQVLQYQ